MCHWKNVCVCATVVRLECMWLYKWLDIICFFPSPKLFSFNNKFFILIDMNFLQNFLNFDWYRYVSRPAYTCVCATVVRLECMWLYKWLDIICFFPSPKLFSFNNKFFILIDMNFLQNVLNFDWYRYVSRPAYTCVCATVVRLECMWLYKWLDIVCFFPGPKLFSFNNKFFILIDMNSLQNVLNFDWYRYVSRPAYTCVCMCYSCASRMHVTVQVVGYCLFLSWPKTVFV